MFESEEDVGLQKVTERDVGGVAFFGEHKYEFRAGFQRYVEEYFGKKHALPTVIEATPARDAMKVTRGFGLREGAKLLPSEAQGHRDQAIDFEVPRRGIESRNAAGVQHGPLKSEGLTRRQTAFGTCLLFFHTASAVIKNTHCFACPSEPEAFHGSDTSSLAWGNDLRTWKRPFWQ